MIREVDGHSDPCTQEPNHYHRVQPPLLGEARVRFPRRIITTELKKLVFALPCFTCIISSRQTAYSVLRQVLHGYVHPLEWLYRFQLGNG